MYGTQSGYWLDDMHFAASSVYHTIKKWNKKRGKAKNKLFERRRDTERGTKGVETGQNCTKKNIKSVHVQYLLRDFVWRSRNWRVKKFYSPARWQDPPVVVQSINHSMYLWKWLFIVGSTIVLRNVV